MGERLIAPATAQPLGEAERAAVADDPAVEVQARRCPTAGARRGTRGRSPGPRRGCRGRGRPGCRPVGDSRARLRRPARRSRGRARRGKTRGSRASVTARCCGRRGADRCRRCPPRSPPPGPMPGRATRARRCRPTRPERPGPPCRIGRRGYRQRTRSAMAGEGLPGIVRLLAKPVRSAGGRGTSRLTGAGPASRVTDSTLQEGSGHNGESRLTKRRSSLVEEDRCIRAIRDCRPFRDGGWAWWFGHAHHDRGRQPDRRQHRQQFVHIGPLQFRRHHRGFHHGSPRWPRPQTSTASLTRAPHPRHGCRPGGADTRELG